MNTPKDTKANAEQITDKLNAALQSALDAKLALREALYLIHTNETEAEFKAPHLEAVVGSLTLTASALARESGDWESYTRDRGMQENAKPLIL